MELKLVGAGLCRTGTMSLKTALERLLGAPCHHMQEVAQDPGQIAGWRRLAAGGTPDWDALLAGYVAAVDFPGCMAWRELAGANPDAPVLLSSRSSPETWWRSVEGTVVSVQRRSWAQDEPDPRGLLLDELLGARFCRNLEDADAMMAAYTAHNDAVRAEVPAGRLVEWRPGDGWEPLCAALGVPVPDEDFPNVNSSAEFRDRAGLSRPGVA